MAIKKPTCIRIGDVMAQSIDSGSPPHLRLMELVHRATETVKKARRHRMSLSGDNFYANKLAELRADATNCFRELTDASMGDVSAMAEMTEIVFSPSTARDERFAISRELNHSLQTKVWRSANDIPKGDDSLFPLSLLAKTRRGYMTVVGRQMNGCYASGWYDAAAVMMRRLVETVVIEAFEANGIANNAKSSSGDFLQLSDLIYAALAERTWNLSRNAKKALPRLRDIGHISAHSRRFTAQKTDIDNVAHDSRIVIEEFLHLAKLLNAD